MADPKSFGKGVESKGSDDGGESKSGTGTTGGTPTTLADLVKDSKKFEELCASQAANVDYRGYMSKSKADAYYSQILNLFPGIESAKVDLALCIWCMMHDLGGMQNFATKPPIRVGGREVAATAIFGEIIPTDDRGYARQFAATRYEKDADKVMDGVPGLRAALTPKALEYGLNRGDEIHVVSFMKGGLPGSRGTGAERVIAKAAGLARRAGAPPAVSQPPAVREVTDVQHSALY